jgi:hypothetical protein
MPGTSFPFWGVGACQVDQGLGGKDLAAEGRHEGKDGSGVGGGC